MRRVAAVVAVGMCVPFMLLAFIVLGHAGDAGASACAPSVPGQTSQPVTSPGTYQGGKFTFDQLVALWVGVGGPTDDGNRDGIPDDVEAAAIALAESGGDASVVNSIGATGLWQIHPGGAQYLDPTENARAAVAKYQGSVAAGHDGFLPWTTFTGADTGPVGSPGPRTFIQYLPAQYQTGVPPTSGTTAPVPAASCDTVGDASVQAIEGAAQQLENMRIGYVYGGGHVDPAVPNPGLDCSSSVSWVLQHAGIAVPTMTSTGFMTWGDPGVGQAVTIYANPVHVFMWINGRFFGTSEFGHPPATGPAWFVNEPSAAYLAGFVARHPPGM